MREIDAVGKHAQKAYPAPVQEPESGIVSESNRRDEYRKQREPLHRVAECFTEARVTVNKGEEYRANAEGNSRADPKAPAEARWVQCRVAIDGEHAAEENGIEPCVSGVTKPWMMTDARIQRDGVQAINQHEPPREHHRGEASQCVELVTRLREPTAQHEVE